MNNPVRVYRVKDRLPREDERPLIGFHDYGGGRCEGGIVFFNPDNKSWAKIGEKCKTPDGEDGYRFEDITDWIDYWAVLPEEE